MKTIIKAALATTAFASAFAAAPAFADETPVLKVTGTAALATDYSLRGISQTNLKPAVQAGMTITHSSGIYVGTWASNLAGNGTFGGANMELDLIGGYSHSLGPVTLDGGVIYYVYPGTPDVTVAPGGHDYFEVYGDVTGKIGPINAKLGANWAPPQSHIRTVPTSKGNNIWVYGELGYPIPGVPVTLKSHVGYSSGDSIYTWGKDVVDYAVGADFTWDKLTLNVSYTGTDLDRTFADANYNLGTEPGHKLTRGRVVATLTAAF